MADPSSCSTPSTCTATWQALIDQLHKHQSFRVHTGNINNYVELKLKRYANSAEELGACLDLQFANLPEDAHVGDNGILLLADKKHRDIAYERDDLKITLKLFLEDFELAYIRDAIEATLSQLSIEVIEQLILAFPLPDNSADLTVEGPWLEQVVGLWGVMETELVATGKVFSVGVADFQLGPLQALYDKVKVKPCVDHFNIEGCCMVPPDLQAYAREHDIQLLTHNDPNPFPLKDIFCSFCGIDKSSQQVAALPVCCTVFAPVWAARYTIWVRRRSLMAAKGYLVQFGSESKTD